VPLVLFPAEQPSDPSVASEMTAAAIILQVRFLSSGRKNSFSFGVTDKRVASIGLRDYKRGIGRSSLSCQSLLCSSFISESMVHILVYFISNL